MAAPLATVPGLFVPYLPNLRDDGPYGAYIRQAKKVCRCVMLFIGHNLDWLREEKIGAVKALFIKFPEAIVLISNRMGPSNRLPGEMINRLSHFLTPIYKLGPNASTLFGFVDVINKFEKMFEPSASQVEYVVKCQDASSTAHYKAKFPLNQWDQRFNRAEKVADWALSVIGCAGYLWKLNHTPTEEFPLASTATWTARYISVKGIYSEGRFLYQTLWVGRSQNDRKAGEKYLPIQRWHEAEQKFVSFRNPTLANEELAGSLFRLSLAVAFLSLDIFKAMAVKENNPKWLDTAVFCAGLAPTFLAPLAMRWWPKMVLDPLRSTASA